MKTFGPNLFIILLFLHFSISGFSQSKDYLVDTDEFNYLIGMEYQNISDLVGFELKNSGRTVYKNGLNTCNATLEYGDYFIVTSEHIKKDFIKGNKTHQIMDILVLEKRYRKCSGCLMPKNEESYTMILSPIGSPRKRASILAAFSISHETGKFDPIDPDDYKGNENAFYNEKSSLN